ncbi:MAG: porin [Phycisphaerales bacterium]
MMNAKTLSTAVLVSLASMPVCLAQSAGASGDEVRAIVAEMLADAESRSSLLQDGGAASAGHDGQGFVFKDAAGNFKLTIAGALQFRYQLNFRDTQDGGPNAAANRGNDDFESGFETRRSRVVFRGHAIDPKLTYFVQTDFSRRDGTLDLLDAWAQYKWDNGVYAKWGQFKMPFLREELVADWTQLAIERSSTNTAFTQDRSQGVELGWKGEQVGLAFAFHDGFNSKNSEFGSTSALGNFGFVRTGGESDWAFTGRAEWKAAGEWKQFDDFTSQPGSSYACLLGAAGHVEGSANDIAASPGGIDTQGDTVYSSWTVDMSVEGDGWNLFAAGIGAHQKTSLLGIGDGSSDDYGFVGQGGFYLPETDWELFARYDAIFQDSDRDLGDSDETFDVVTVGTHYYWAGHAAKFSFDVQWFLDESTQLMSSNGGNGFLRTTEENEVNLRFQFQLLF